MKKFNTMSIIFIILFAIPLIAQIDTVNNKKEKNEIIKNINYFDLPDDEDTIAMFKVISFKVKERDKKLNIRGSTEYIIERVDVGDVVFAATKPGYLNIPIVIGEVTAVEPDDEHPLLWEITVQPVEDMTQLSDVAVIVTVDF